VVPHPPLGRIRRVGGLLIEGLDVLSQLILHEGLHISCASSQAVELEPVRVLGDLCTHTTPTGPWQLRRRASSGGGGGGRCGGGEEGRRGG
jgi:hypothetical protein